MNGHADAPPARRLGPRSELVLLLGWSLLLFGALLPGGYLADDYFLIAQRAGPDGSVAWSRLGDLWTRGTWVEGPAVVRPVWRASYVLDLAFVHAGWGAAASRALEFALHGLCAWLLVRWARALGAARGVARLAGFLAVVLPVGTEAVVWVAARCDLLAAVGVLAAAALRADQLARPEAAGRRREVFVWLAMVFGLWSKESAAAGGLLLLAQEFLHPARARIPLAARLAAARGFLARGLLVAVALAVHRRWMLGTLVGGYDGETASAGELVLSFGRNLCSLAFPVAGFYPLPMGPGSTRIALAVGLAALAALILWRRSGPVLRLAALWLLGSLAVLGGLRVDDPRGPHTRLLYQPSLAWTVLLCAGLGRLASLAQPVAGEADGGGATGASSADPLPRSLAQAGGVAIGVAALALHRPSTADYGAAALETGRLEAAVRAELAAVEAGEGTGAPRVFVGVPDRRGRALMGLNVFPSLLEPPFVGRAPGARAVGLSDEERLAGRYDLPTALFLIDPECRLLGWTGEAFERLGELAHAGPRDALLPLALEGRGAERRLRLEGAEPGARALLLVGELGPGADLGRAGRLGLVDPWWAPVGRVGSEGNLVVEPSTVASRGNRAGAAAVQILVAGADGLRLSGTRTLGRSQR